MPQTQDHTISGDVALRFATGHSSTFYCAQSEPVLLYRDRLKQLRSIPVRHVDVFTEKAFSGNPLTVIPNAVSLSDSEMHAIAAEFGTPETSFILPAKGDADCLLRIFSPIKEIPFAGHPVLGAAHVYVSELSREKDASALHAETGVGVLRLQVIRENKVAKLVMDQGRPKLIGGLTEDQLSTVEDALRLDRAAVAGFPQIVSTGLPQLFLQLKALGALSKMTPDLVKVKKIEEQLGLTGIGVFTLETVNPQDSVHLRFFAPSIGINEDAAAGSAAGGVAGHIALCNILPNKRLRGFSIEQGLEIERPSRLYVNVELKDNVPDNIRVGGYSVTVSAGNIYMP